MLRPETGVQNDRQDVFGHHAETALEFHTETRQTLLGATGAVKENMTGDSEDMLLRPWRLPVGFTLIVETLGIVLVMASEGSTGRVTAIVVFLLAFPVVVLAAFFLLLWWKPYHLFPPGDFQSDVFARKFQGISNAVSDKIRSIVSSQVELLVTYHDLILKNAQRSFQSALLAAIVGIIFFVLAVAFVLFKQPQDTAIITVVSGALVEFIAGVNFVLYGKASKQLTEFQTRLETIQRYVLADSVCEELSDSYRERVRSLLVLAIAGINDIDPDKAWPINEKAKQEDAADGYPPQIHTLGPEKGVQHGR